MAETYKLGDIITYTVTDTEVQAQPTLASGTVYPAIVIAENATDNTVDVDVFVPNSVITVTVSSDGTAPAAPETTLDKIKGLIAKIGNVPADVVSELENASESDKKGILAFLESKLS